MFKPGKTQVKDPLVQKTTRGRPVGLKQKPPKVPDLKKNPPGLRKSKSSRPREYKVPDLNKPPPAQPARQSEYAPTTSRFDNTHDYFDDLKGARHSMYEPSQSCRYPEKRNLFEDQSHPEAEWVKYNPDFSGNLHPYPGLDDIYTFGEPSQSYGVGETPFVTQKLYGFGETSQAHWLNYDQPYSNLVDDFFGAPQTQPNYAPIYETTQEQVSDPESEAQSSTSWVGYVVEPYNASLSKNYHWVLDEIPSYLRPYVVGAQNVKGDGNCGFRATAVALGLDEEMGAEWVRTQMLAEYESDLDGYMQMFGQTEGTRMLSALQTSYYGRSRPRDYWMSKVWFHILLANKLGIIINCVSLRDPAQYSRCITAWINCYSSNR
uniref:uncharacterized protein LOC122583918 n=1 Tax=Erigeron canadensis TaxID=72917 RepID=UPI001CB8BADC|nr:uncharacterized protein LOC122583918 [Erigeron canadensis]